MVAMLGKDRAFFGACQCIIYVQLNLTMWNSLDVRKEYC